MNSLFDVFGFLAVVLKGLDLVAQSILVGSVAFALFVVAPLPALTRPTHRVMRVAAIATLATASMTTILTAIVLWTSLDIRFGAIAGATFFVAGMVRAAAAAMIAVVASSARNPSWLRRMTYVIAAVIVLCAALADTHAIARIGDVAPLMLATAAHELGAGLWLGGLPCLWLTLRHAEPRVAGAVGRRFSIVAASGVVSIVAGAAVFARHYIGTPDAVYGTSYGAMAATKGLLLAILLAIGLVNYRSVRRIPGDAAMIRRVLRFVEVEIVIGVAVLMAAASITSAPPSVDVADRVALAQLVDRFAPTTPRMSSPAQPMLAAPGTASSDPAARNADDRAWSEYNHHWAGLAVVIMGVAALVLHSGRARWAHHWPLLFLVLAAFLLLRADPEVWPMGPVGAIESLHDPEVVQHRLFVVLIVAFALFEWRVRIRRRTARVLPRVFPLVAATGGMLLLMHSHAVGDVKEQLLIEMTHLPIAVLGVVAGCARWLEVAAPNEEGRWARWVWPSAFVLIGLLLLDYREA